MFCAAGCCQGDKTLDGYQKKKYVCKLLFIFLLGHDIDFGHMEAVNLLSSNKYTEKQIVRCLFSRILLFHLVCCVIWWNNIARYPETLLLPINICLSSVFSLHQTSPYAFTFHPPSFIFPSLSSYVARNLLLWLLAMRSDQVQSSKRSESRGQKVKIGYRLGVASWCGIYCVGDASQVDEECRHLQHSRLRE